MRKKKLLRWTLSYPTEKDPRPARVLTLAGNMLPDDIIEHFTKNKIFFSAETDLCHGGILRFSKKMLEDYPYVLHLSESLWRLDDKDIALNIVMQLAHFYLGHDNIPRSENNKLKEQQQNEALKLMKEWVYQGRQDIKAS
jgi:hypothetical protein